MFDELQADVSRNMAESRATNAQIEKEISGMSEYVKNRASQEFHKIVQKYGLKKSRLLQQGLKAVGNQFNVDPATIYYVYIQWFEE